MLVYSNILEFQGKSSQTVLLKALGGWLKGQMDKGLHPDQLRSDGFHTGTKKDGTPTRLKIAVTNSGTPQLFSWVLTHGDPNGKRTWETELGARVIGEEITFSVNVTVEEHSVLVSEYEVTPAPPRVVHYLARNIRNDPETRFSSQAFRSDPIVLRSSEDSLTLKEAIYNPARELPIVLLSPGRFRTYTVDAKELQDYLIGLATVYQVHTDLDTFELSSIVTDRYSAYNGAVNIINTPSKSGNVRNKLVTEHMIMYLADSFHERAGKILTWLSSMTNWRNAERRISCDTVLRASSIRQLSAIRDTISTEHQPYINLAESYKADYDRIEAELIATKRDMEAIQDELDDLKSEHHALKSRAAELTIEAADSSAVFTPHDAIYLVMTGGRPSVLDCLNIIKSAYPDRFVILPSAIKSAKEHEHFQEERKFMSLLYTLADEYYELLITKGDAEAKRVFGRFAYAATESESAKNNERAVKERTFIYNGRPITMFKHLKINKEDSSVTSIRMYFEWDAEERKFIIGHCGRHLHLS